MALRILLATAVSWRAAARLAGAFAGAGAQVEALFAAGHVLGKSRFVSGRHSYNPYFPQASLAQAVARAAPDLIVPCDDRALALVLAHAPNAGLLARSFGRLRSAP